MSQNLNNMQISTLAMLMSAINASGEDAARRALQALAEKKPPGKSSLDSKIVAEFGGASFTEANFQEILVFKGQQLKRHRKGGGWVPAEQDENDTSKPFVAESVYVGPFAMVFGNARIFGSSRIDGGQAIDSGRHG